MYFNEITIKSIHPICSLTDTNKGKLVKIIQIKISLLLNSFGRNNLE